MARGLALLFLLLAVGAAAAQSLPGLPPAPEPAAEPGWLQDFWVWLQLQQAALRRELVELLGELKAGNSGALVGLLVGSFIYGVAHAAGPGHGKLIISSYLFANGSQVRSGLKLTAISSLLQAVSAILLVGLLAVVLDRARLQVARDVQILEIASYALIVVLGQTMLWRSLAGGRFRHDAHHSHQDLHRHDLHARARTTITAGPQLPRRQSHAATSGPWLSRSASGPAAAPSSCCSSPSAKDCWRPASAQPSPWHWARR
jgi:ABC-type nickel/cobalt efflux system permease component RcnA